MIITQAIGLVLLAWAVGRVVYNVFFHPLRSFPGPLLNRATPLPRMYYRLAGRSPFYTHTLHQRYGKVVRLSPNELSFIDADAWRDIYGHGGTSMPRDQRAMARVADQEPAMISILDDAEHRRQRQIFAPAFSARALQQQEPLLRSHVDLLIQQLRQRAVVEGQAIDMVDFFNFTTFDIMGDLAFGAPLGLLRRAEYTPWIRDTFAGIKLFALNAAVVYYVPLVARIMPHLLPRSLHRKRAAHLARTADQVAERLARKTTRPDIWTLVLRPSPTPLLTPAQILSNASLFMIAGTETTATLLAGCLYLLTTHPHALARLTTELRSGDSSSSGAGATTHSLTALARLPYLAAVLEETLRIYPPVPDGTLRRVPEGGARVAGHFIPADATVGVAQYAAFRSPAAWSDAEHWWPERWIDRDGEKWRADERGVLQPFSVGPRNCLGMNLAYHEARLILASLLVNFDVELCAESKGWMPEQKAWALWSKTPLMVRLRGLEGR